MNEIKVTKIKKTKNRIEYEYLIQGEWKKYFDFETLFWVEYNEEIEDVPDSIAIIPFLGNIIIMASLFGGKIYVDELDQDFYSCIPSFLEGFEKIYPQIKFKKSELVQVNVLVRNEMNQNANGSFIFFSGGADACSTLISHVKEQPKLVTIWGADIPYDHEDAWKNAMDANKIIADQFQLHILTIRSTLRRFINEKNLNEYSREITDDNWWSAFHHSIGMMCLAAPLTNNEIQTLYFAATYSEKDLQHIKEDSVKLEKQWYAVASDPSIDNHVSFAGCQVIHDGFEYNRHDKVKRICYYAKDNKKVLPLRVCFRSETGGNCCKCEKCCNTIMSILLTGSKPEEFGFLDVDDNFYLWFAAGLQEMARAEHFAFLSFYSDIHDEYQIKNREDQVPRALKAFYHNSMDELADFLCVPCNECLEKDKKIASFYDLIQGKNWLESEYHALRLKIEEIEIEDSKKRDWIVKLGQDIEWLESEKAFMKQEIERLKARKSFVDQGVNQVRMLVRKIKGFINFVFSDRSK